jgi:hypothetical protein
MLLKLITLITLSFTTLFALSAQEIAQKAHDREDGDNSVANMKMILIDKSNNTRSRELKVFTKDKGDDEMKLMFFLSPADVKNTAFLTYDYEDSNRDDDQWLYLPELQKVKRIASSDKSSSFMGSDFTYSDMTSRNVEDYTYIVMKEPEVKGDKTWQIEVTPKSQKTIEETGYAKSIYFIRQDNFVIVQALHFVRDGGKLKYMMVNELEKIDGVWTPLEIQMVTKQGKQTLHKTVLRFSDYKYNQKLEESLFTTRTLEKGL